MKRKRQLGKRNKSTIIGIACAVGCATCVALYVGQVDAAASEAQAEMLARYGGDQIEVCVAKRDIAAGEIVSDSDIETKMWIAALLPSNAITNKGDCVGQQLGSAILAGEVISSARFGFENSEIDVPEGLTAISVPARDVQAVGGALKAGMKTDIYAVGAGSTTKIATQVLVLESFKSEGGVSSATAWITLAITPDKVEEMVNAAENLQLYFVLPSALAASNEADSIGDDTNSNEGESGSSEASTHDDGDELPVDPDSSLAASSSSESGGR